MLLSGISGNYFYFLKFVLVPEIRIKINDSVNIICTSNSSKQNMHNLVFCLNVSDYFQPITTYALTPAQDFLPKQVKIYAN